MKQLKIRLRGEITSTNFDEWKEALIASIQSVNRDLVTDNDFNEAEGHVRSFRAAEQALRDAKQSALSQSQEIQELFLSIDDVTKEARQARLSLERQITARKQTIKDEYIQSGINEIKEMISEQSDNFNGCDLSRFLDRAQYEVAVHGRRGRNGLEAGIKQVVSGLKELIDARAVVINNNKLKLDSLPERYKFMFQDYNQLVCRPSEQLDVEIDQRIENYKTSPVNTPSEESAEDKINEAEEVVSEESEFRMVIKLKATQEEARIIKNKIHSEYSQWIKEIELS